MTEQNFTPLFTIPETKNLINRRIARLQQSTAKSDFVNNLTSLYESTLSIIVSDPEEFDRNCQKNIEWIGQDFTSSLYNPPIDKSETSLLNEFVMAYRFVIEFEFSIPNELSFELRQLKSFVKDNLESFPPIERSQLVFANYLMPAEITRKFLNHPNISAFTNFSSRVSEAETMKSQWDSEITQKQNAVSTLKEQLDKIEKSFNFVGLVDGFKNLKTDKTGELRVAFWSLIAIGFLVIFPLAYEIYFITNNLEIISKNKETLIYTIPALAGLELILIYFFRVVLVQFRSVKAQLLQLNLRVSLCQFIENYAEYASKIKKQDAGSLEKFESLIFSGILIKEESLPSTFDGIEQIGKLLASIKGTQKSTP